MKENTAKTSKKRRSPFDIPYLGAILLVAIAELILQGTNGIISMFIPEDNRSLLVTVCCSVSIVIGLVMLILYRVFTRKKYRGALSWNALKDWRLWTVIAVSVLLDAGIIVYDIFRVGYGGVQIVGICVSLSAGICEECVFRSMMMSNMMKCYKGKGNYLHALIFSSVLFGVFHFMNIFSGANALSTVAQVIGTIGMGFFFGAVFLSSGNIVYPIVLHALHDFLTSLVYSASMGTTTNPPAAVDWIEIAVYVVIYALSAFFILWKQKDRICKLWDEKWTPKEVQPKAEEPTPADNN